MQTHTHHPVLGVCLKLVSILLLSSMAVCVKYLGSDIPAGEIIFVRGLISMPVLAFIAWRVAGLKLLRTRNLRSHALRSLMGTVAMFFWFKALLLIPLADFTAISFTTPMFLTILAMVFLGERIHVYRWSALAIGFAGVLVMIGPRLTLGESGTIGITVSLAAAICAAFAMMFLRGMSRGGTEHAITITFYFALTSMVFGGFTAIAGWPMPTAGQWPIIALAGFFGVFGQLLMSYSYRFAEASTIAPLDYASLLTSIGYGYLLFDEVPSPSTWFGAPLIIFSGLIILWREYRTAVQQLAAARAAAMGSASASDSS